MDPRQEQISNILGSMLNVLGRDDVRVIDVKEEDGTIHFILAEGKMTHADRIPSELLEDRLELSRRLNTILQAEHPAPASSGLRSG